jgi:DNA-binding Lrp family transcriptional regulator
MHPKREDIISLFKANIPKSEISKRLQVSFQTVSNTINRFQELGISADRPKSGRPASVNTLQVRDKIKKRLTRNPRQSLRSLSKKINLKRETVRRIVKNALKLKPYKLQKAHLLTDKMKTIRLERAKVLLGLATNGVHQRIVFSDEKIFTIEQSFNRQNDRMWLRDVQEEDSEARKVCRTQNPESVMVWAGITGNGKTSLVFIDKGVKVDQVIYRNKILADVLLPWSKQHFGNNHWIFQQDSAPAHKAAKTQTWCREHFPGFISSQEWPPYSPDLNPLDYSVWSILESRACATPHKNVESLKLSLQAAWDTIDENMLRQIVDNFPKRLKAVIKAKGGYIES